MPLDAVCLTALLNEMAPVLTGARIDKVQQPARDLLLLSLYAPDYGGRKLLISAGVGSARVHFTDERMENPDAPPMFCMLLRKHLIGARINAVTQPPWERSLALDISGRDELGVVSGKTLYCELMGRGANVILADGEGRIIDCMRRADFGEDAYRRLLPGMLYKPPQPQAKPVFFAVPSAERRALRAAAPETQAEDWLLDTFGGLSPLIAREIAYRGGEEHLGEAMDAFSDSVAAGEFTPELLLVDGKPKDFSFMPIRQYGAKGENRTYPGFCALLDFYYASRDRAERMRRASADTVKAVRTSRDRQARKLAQQREELKATEGREELKKQGELLTANLWRVKKGDRSLVCEDYYTDGSPQVELRLDPMKTPQQNAAAFYKEYKKKAAAEQHLTQLIGEGDALLDYLESVLDELARCESEKDVAEIRRELSESGVLRRQKTARLGKPRKEKPRGPMRFISTDGSEILVGRSNAQNDELTTKLARRTDLWLHTQRVHGSHVIVRCEGETPSDRTVAEAASLAAYSSQARDGGKTPVDYTQVRFVKKPSGALPGKVIYTEYSTVMAQGDEALVKSLQTK